jgi:hypothetical protein
VSGTGCARSAAAPAAAAIRQADLSVDHGDHAPGDAGTPIGHLDLQHARPPHLLALANDEALPAGALEQVGAKRTGRRARRRVLTAGHSAREHPGPRLLGLGVEPDQVEGRRLARARLGARKRPVDLVEVGCGPCQRAGVRQRDDRRRQAGGDDLGRKVGMRLGGVEPDRSHRRGTIHLGAELGRVLDHLRAPGPVLRSHLDRLQARPRLLHEARHLQAAPAGYGDRGAERGVPGEGDLHLHGEDPVPVVGPLGARRLHEGGLGEACLPRHGEHRLVADAISVIDHGQAISGQRPLGEDVQPGDPVGHAHMIAIAIGGPLPALVFSAGIQPNKGEREMDEKYPLTYAVDYPDRELSRLTTFFRIFTIIPIAIVLETVSGGNYSYSLNNTTSTAAFAGGLLVAAPLLMILFRKKYPRWWFDWNRELLRFSNRVGIYFALLNDQYPSTDEEQSLHLEIDYPNAETDLARGMPLVKWLLAIPHYVVLFFLYIGAFFCVIFAWFAILFTGRYPKSLFDFIVGVARWHNRVVAYALLLVTDKYPPFSLE